MRSSQANVTSNKLWKTINVFRSTFETSSLSTDNNVDLQLCQKIFKLPIGYWGLEAELLESKQKI